MKYVKYLVAGILCVFMISVFLFAFVATSLIVAVSAGYATAIEFWKSL